MRLAAAHLQEDRGERPLTIALAMVAVPLASSAIVLRVAIWFGLSFHTASWALACVAALAMAAAGYSLLPARPGPGLQRKRMDTGAVLILAAACLSAALTVVCLHRPDSDDAIYLPKIVHAVAHPEMPIDGTVYEIAHTPALALPLSAAAYYPTAYEFSQAAFAHLSGIDLLWVYYRLAPVLTAIFGTFLLAAILRLLGLPVRASAFAALVSIPLILLMGENHRSLGNFTLARMFQAKCAFMFLGLPMFAALSLLFFRRPGVGSWVMLCVGVIALSGMTTSALVMLPLLSLPLFLAWWVVFGHGGSVRSGLARGVAYAVALVPALAFALDYRRYAIAYAGYGSSLNAGFPKSFVGQFDLITNGSASSPTLILSLFSVLVLGRLWREPRHGLLLATAALVALFYLNPWAAPWVMRYLSSENIYWRLFYLPPLLLMIGAAVGSFYARMVSGGRLLRSLPVLLFLALVAAAFFSPTSVLRKDNHVEISLRGYPLDAYTDDAKACLELAPPGVVLAPVALAQDMVILSARHRQVVTRPDFLRNTLSAEPGEAARRMSAAAVANGKGGKLDDFVAVVRDLGPSTVIVARKAMSPDLTAFLRSEGMHQAGTVGAWIVYGHDGTAVTQP